MNQKRCPSEVELLSFVDGEMPPEQLKRIAEHVAHCGICEPQVGTLRSLIADIKAPLRRADGDVKDVASHVASVMARLDEPVKTAPPQRARWSWITTTVAAAAAVVLYVRLVPPSGDALTPTATRNDTATSADVASTGLFTPRGNASEPSLGRDVGVQLYTFTKPLAPLQPGGKVRRNSALTAGLRNLAQETAHLLLFAIDSKQVVHWIAPAFTDANSDPTAHTVHPAQGEQPLPNSVTFEDLAVGPLRVVAVIAPAPLRVSDIEKLTPQELSTDLALRFPRAVVRQVVVEVVP